LSRILDLEGRLSLMKRQARIAFDKASKSCGFMKQILKGHVPPCVVLVINDNPYGLMFALSYICRTCP
jgi:hypothetical protein